MSAIQTALPWGRETRILGTRKQPGILFNLIQWSIRTFGKAWAKWEWFAKRLLVSVPTVKRWFRLNASKWGLERKRVGPRRWEFVRCEVIRHQAQTDPPHGVQSSELEPSTREVSSPPEASVGETDSLGFGSDNAAKDPACADADAPNPVACEKPGTDSRPPRAKSAVLATGEFPTPSPEGSEVPGKKSEAYQTEADVVPVGVSSPSAVGGSQESGRQTRGSVCPDARNQDRDRIGLNTATSAGWPQHPVRPEKYVTAPAKTPLRAIPDFDAYFQTFVDAGVALNEIDRMRACREWISLHEEDRSAALSDALILCAGRKACYIPLPVNHLRSRNWTRVAKPRTLEFKPEERPEELTWLQRVARGLEKFV